MRLFRRRRSADVDPANALTQLTDQLPTRAGAVAGAPPGSNPDDWEELRSTLQRLLAAVPDGEYADRVSAQHKVLNHLVVTDQRERAARFVQEAGLKLAGRRTRLDPQPSVELPLGDDPGATIPADLSRLSLDQTTVRSAVRSIEVRGDGDVEVTGWAHITNVDLAETDQEVTARLVRADGRTAALQVEGHPDPSVDEEVTTSQAWCDYRPSGITVVLPVSRLDPGEWTVELSVRVGAVVRSGTWSRPRPQGTAGASHCVATPTGVAVVSARPGGPLTVSVFSPSRWIERVDVEHDEVALTGAGAPPDELTLVRRGDEPSRTALTPEPAATGWSARVPLDKLAAGDTQVTRWGATYGDGGDHEPLRYGPPPARSSRTCDPRVLADADPRGRLRLSVRPRVARVTEVRVEEDRVILAVEAYGASVDALEAQLDPGVATGAANDAPMRATEDRGAEIVFALRRTRWGVPDSLLPSGDYALRIRERGSGTEIPAVVAPGLAERLPVDDLTEQRRVRVHTGRGLTGVTVQLLPPLLPGERGLSQQRRLQEVAHAGTAREPAVFFRCLFGEAANDTALELHRELRRRGSPLRLYWSVQDRSVPVPEGGIGLIEGSEDWHHRLGEAAYVVVNQHEPRWYHKRPGQVMVQTFHGYPYKCMGRPWWDLKEVTADLIASNYRVSGDWDFLVSPAPYATPLLLQAFFDERSRRRVRVVEAGYPRNDALLSPQADDVRRRTRQRLGLTDDQIAVLYAPTFRDVLSLDAKRAGSTDIFDPGAAAAALGPDHVVLVRGHAYHARAATEAAAGPGVVDVTTYPDVAELCLASDAAVLDYSSLRFDYALLGRPMVFLVPDVEEYHRLRPGLVDYDQTAPGPHVATTAEVVAELSDLAGLAARHRAAREEFVATFLPLEDGHSAERVVSEIFGSDIGDPLT